jgi:hypothetical protein
MFPYPQATREANVTPHCGGFKARGGLYLVIVIKDLT